MQMTNQHQPTDIMKNTTNTSTPTFTATNVGGYLPEAKVVVSEEFYNKVQQIEQLLEAFNRMSPALSASLRDHYRNGVSDWDIDENLAFLMKFKFGLVTDILKGM